MSTVITGLQSVTVSRLKSTDKLGSTLFHESGEEMVKAGNPLDLGTIAIIKRLGVEFLYQVTSDKSRQEFEFYARYKPVEVKKLPENLVLKRNLLDYNENIIIHKGETLTAEIRDKLLAKGIETVYMRKTPAERGMETVRKFRAAYEMLRKAEELEIENNRVTDIAGTTLTELEKTDLTQEIPKGQSLLDALSTAPNIIERQKEEKALILNLKEDTFKNLRALFEIFKSAPEFLKVSEKVYHLSRKVIASLVRDRELLLNSINLDDVEDDENYMLSHAVNTATISVNVATAMGYSAEQVMEIAYAAFLHDIGMFKIPERITNKKGKLTRLEFLTVQKHSGYSFDYLQRAGRLPAVTPLVIYQIHEREDRSGYPKKRSGRFIHPYAKIIAVADVYAALTSHRPYRPALSPYQAMQEIVKMGAEKKLNVEVIKALLKFVCLFPVGSWVKLNDGAIGKVISPNIEDYTKPVVRVLYDKQGNETFKTINLAEKNRYGIVQGLDWDEKYAANMVGF